MSVVHSILFFAGVVRARVGGGSFWWCRIYLWCYCALLSRPRLVKQYVAIVRMAAAFLACCLPLGSSQAGDARNGQDAGSRPERTIGSTVANSVSSRRHIFPVGGDSVVSMPSDLPAATPDPQHSKVEASWFTCRTDPSSLSHRSHHKQWSSRDNVSSGRNGGVRKAVRRAAPFELTRISP
jgi:hypothetical protein